MQAALIGFHGLEQLKRTLPTPQTWRPTAPLSRGSGLPTSAGASRKAGAAKEAPEGPALPGVPGPREALASPEKCGGPAGPSEAPGRRPEACPPGRWLQRCQLRLRPACSDGRGLLASRRVPVREAPPGREALRSKSQLRFSPCEPPELSRETFPRPLARLEGRLRSARVGWQPMRTHRQPNARTHLTGEKMAGRKKKEAARRTPGYVAAAAAAASKAPRKYIYPGQSTPGNCQFLFPVALPVTKMVLNLKEPSCSPLWFPLVRLVPSQRNADPFC